MACNALHCGINCLMFRMEVVCALRVAVLSAETSVDPCHQLQNMLLVTNSVEQSPS